MICTHVNYNKYVSYAHTRNVFFVRTNIIYTREKKHQRLYIHSIYFVRTTETYIHDTRKLQQIFFVRTNWQNGHIQIRKLFFGI